jgi:hypothetical protein
MGISNVSNGLRSGVCTSSTRPTAPYEGQMIYETDTDMVALWNGTAWRYIAATTPTNGTVLQVVSANLTTQQTFTSSTASASSLTASITPKSSSSKVLVMVSVNGINRQSSDTGLNLWLYRGGSSIAHFGRQVLKMDGNSSQSWDATSSIDYLDSPATTSSTTYTVWGASSGNSSFALFNHSSITTSTVTLMEIAG